MPRVERWRRATVLSLSSAFGLGYLPRAPGTFGTLAALPIWWAVAGWSVAAQLALVVVVGGLAVWVAAQAEWIYARHDVSKVVIDEVAGMLVAVVGVAFVWPNVVAGFVLFRLFDVLKPFPIRWLDRHVGGGFGVVLDDLMAGVYAGVLLHAFQALWIAALG